MGKTERLSSQPRVHEPRGFKRFTPAQRIQAGLATLAVGGGAALAAFTLADGFDAKKPAPSPSASETVGPRVEATRTPSASPSPSDIPSESKAGLIQVPMYNQDDPRWATVRYSINGGDNSIAEVGCTESVIAMAARWVSGNSAITPVWVNSGHYHDALSMMSYRHLGDELGHPLMWLDESSGTGIGNYVQKSSPLHQELLDSVRQSLARGQPVALGMILSDVVQVPDIYGHVHTMSGGMHSVLAVGVDDQGRILINDPWQGQLHLLEDYMDTSGYRGIYRADAILPATDAQSSVGTASASTNGSDPAAASEPTASATATAPAAAKPTATASATTAAKS